MRYPPAVIMDELSTVYGKPHVVLNKLKRELLEMRQPKLPLPPHAIRGLALKVKIIVSTTIAFNQEHREGQATVCTTFSGKKCGENPCQLS